MSQRNPHEVDLPPDLETDPVIKAIYALSTVEIAKEMYERAREREKCLSMVRWNKLDHDEQYIRCDFVTECLNVIINQYRDVRK